MGEAGVVVPPAGFLEAAREACDAHGALLHLDEVQGGVGRVGAWLTSRVTAPGVVPDVVTLAKALGGGLPHRRRRRQRPRRHGAAARATTARRSAATRSSAPPRSPSCDTVEQDGLLAAATHASATACAAASSARPTRSSSRSAGSGCGSASC